MVQMTLGRSVKEESFGRVEPTSASFCGGRDIQRFQFHRLPLLFIRSFLLGFVFGRHFISPYIPIHSILSDEFYKFTIKHIINQCNQLILTLLC